jgi:hypothetical protein
MGRRIPKPEHVSRAKKGTATARPLRVTIQKAPTRVGAFSSHAVTLLGGREACLAIA